MRFRSGVVIAAMVASLGGCATALDAGPIAPTGAFEPGQFTWSEGRGRNVIAGDAVLRTRGGEVRTCAGLQAEAFPSAAYSDEYVSLRFGASGFDDLSGLEVRRAVAADPGLDRFRRTTTCDAQGRFTFSGLADGTWYVVARVTWEAPAGGRHFYMSQQGGDLVQRVEVRGGETRNVTLSLGNFQAPPSSSPTTKAGVPI